MEINPQIIGLFIINYLIADIWNNVIQAERSTFNYIH